MNKQTKLILGIGLVAVAGILVFNAMNKPKPTTTTTNFRGRKRNAKGSTNSYGNSTSSYEGNTNTYGGVITGGMPKGETSGSESINCPRGTRAVKGRDGNYYCEPIRNNNAGSGGSSYANSQSNYGG